MHQNRLDRSPGSLSRFDRFVLHGEIFSGAGQAVFVRSAISNRGGDEVSMRWRRRRSPLQSGRLPRIVVHFFTVVNAPEKIDDERNLRESYDPRRPRDASVPLKTRKAQYVLP